MAQREAGLVSEAELIAEVVEARMNLSRQFELSLSEEFDGDRLLDDLNIAPDMDIYLFAPSGEMLAWSMASDRVTPELLDQLTTDPRSTVITDILNSIWNSIYGLLRGGGERVATRDWRG